MGRRRSREVGFESDSFLDIIANIVGILIILIVIAGVRVSNAPLASPVTKKEPLIEAEVLPEPKPVPLVVPVPEVAEVPEVEFPLEPEFAAADPQQLLEVDQKIELAQHQLALFDNELNRFSTEKQSAIEKLIEFKSASEKLSQQKQELSQVEQSIKASLQATLADLKKESQLSKERVNWLISERDNVTSLREQALELQNQINSVEQAPSAAIVIQHKLTPVSQVVEGKELHFLVQNGRVAYVPIEELLMLLKPQIARRKGWLAKHHQHRGRVGPVRGFMLDYVVEKVTSSPLIGQQSGMIRIQLTGWQIVPTDDVIAETAEEAFEGRSKFILSLREAEKNTTLTFWVYSDSFAAYRKIQDFAHRQGFSVAGRPLPDGIPISGSPHGSRSAGQ